MEQREVQDDENIRWVCVQALSGVEGAEERLSGRDGPGSRCLHAERRNDERAPRVAARLALERP
jgi:hypothetical protein